MALTLAYLCLGMVVTLLVLLTFLLSYSAVAHQYWKTNGVFSLETQLLFGNAKSVVLQKEGMGMSMKHLYDTLKRNGLAFGGYYFLTRPILVLADINLIKRVLITDFSHFVDHPFYLNEEKDPLSAHLYALQGEKWKTRRSKLGPAFSAGRLKIMFETIAKCCNQLKAVIDESVSRGDAIDIMDIIANMGVDMIGSCAFGLECNSFKNSNNEFKHFGLQYFHNTSKWRAFVFSLLFMFPDLSRKLNLTPNSQEMIDFYVQLVRDIAQHREKNNIVRKDFMHTLLQIKNNAEISENSLGSVMPSVQKGEDGATIAEIAAHCFSFFIAGFEPFATTTSFCLYELSLNTTLQDNLREEIISVLDTHEGELTYNAVMGMGLLDRCLKETLRKHTPAISHIRLCTEAYKIPNSNFTLPKGTTVLIPVYGIHMDPEYYPNPEIFDPDRFLEDNLTKRPVECWMPFGLGPRQCVAYSFGLLEIKAALVTLLKRYRFSLHPSTKTPITMCPKNAGMYPSSTIYLSAEKI